MPYQAQLAQLHHHFHHSIGASAPSGQFHKIVAALSDPDQSPPGLRAVSPLRPRMRLIRLSQVVEHLLTTRIEFATLAWRGARDGVGGQQREGDGGVSVDNDSSR